MNPSAQGSIDNINDKFIDCFFFLLNSQPTDAEKTTMDMSEKIAADAKNTFNEPASEHSSGSPDPSSRTSRPDKFQDSSKSSSITVTKSTVSTKITEVASTMLNVSQNENHKSPTSTGNEEESQVEISGRVIGSLIIY